MTIRQRAGERGVAMEIEVGDRVVRKGRTSVGKVVKVLEMGRFTIAVEYPARSPLAFYAPDELEVVN